MNNLRPHAVPNLDLLTRTHTPPDPVLPDQHDFSYAIRNRRTAREMAKALTVASKVHPMVTKDPISGAWLVNIIIPCCNCHFMAVHEAMDALASLFNAEYIGCGKYFGDKTLGSIH